MGVREYPNITRVYLDMDGVIADFERSAHEHEMAPKNFKRVAGAYLELEPMPGAVEAVKDLEAAGFLVFALTKIPRSNPYAATEKLLWAKRHFSSLEDRIIITPDKGARGNFFTFPQHDQFPWR